MVSNKELYDKEMGNKGMQGKGMRGKARFTLLDQGPIYTLARLSESAIWTKQSARVAHKKNRIFTHWATSLDGVIWLDAPTNTLLERVYTRRKRHIVESMPYSEASAWLEWHKTLYAQTVEQLTTDDGPKIYRFDTAQKTPDEIVREILETFDSLSQQEAAAYQNPEHDAAPSTHRRREISPAVHEVVALQQRGAPR